MNTEMVKNLVRRSHSHLVIFVFGGQTDTGERAPAGRPAFRLRRTHTPRKKNLPFGTGGALPPHSNVYYCIHAVYVHTTCMYAAHIYT